MTILEIEQGTPAWFQAKAGIPSASNFDKVLTCEGTVSKQLTKYIWQLAGEAITGMPEESYQNQAMLRGVELEDEARKLYEMITGTEVKQVGFCIEDGVGCSPDGLVGEDGCLEIKCPQIATHVGYLLGGKLPTDYFQQTQGQLMVTGRKWLDFVSHFPAMRPLIIRVERDEKFITALRKQLVLVNAELKSIIEKIK